MTQLHKSLWKWAKNSVWTFPLVLLLLLLLLTSLKISGSSIGIYQEFFYGEGSRDENFISGEPRPIRSDEWLVTTQLTITQERAGYPRINQNVGEGLDMSIIGDLPYREWSAAFKPQNLAFLVLPLEYAFAFKWWLLLYLLIVSCYFFTLKLLPKKRLLSALLAAGFGLSPFVWWWYLSGTIASLFYGFFILILFMRILDKEKIPLIKSPVLTDLVHFGLLSYLLISFALLIYPPYQIPIVIAVSTFAVGYILQKLVNEKTQWKQLLSRLLIMAGAAAVALSVVAIFLLTRIEAIRAITSTVYPGTRTETSGGLNSLHITDSFLQPQLQYEPQAFHFFGNQSEDSNFILVMPFLLLPGFLLLINSYRKYKKIDWLLLSIQLVLLVLLARVFIPFGDPIYKFLLLDKVPHKRLKIGFGFIGFLQLLLVVRGLAKIKLKNFLWIAVYGAIVLAVLLMIGFSVLVDYPKFIQNPLKIIVFAAMFASIPVLILYRKFLAAATVILLFCAVSVWRINPLYKGLGPLNDGPLSQTVQSISQPQDTLVGVDSIVIENIGLINGRDSISGVIFYPDLKFWEREVGSQYQDIYNRYAHFVFSSSITQRAPLQLGHLDTVLVKLDCSDFVTQQVEYAVATGQINLPCAKLVKTVSYPAITFFIYSI